MGEKHYPKIFAKSIAQKISKFEKIDNTKQAKDLSNQQFGDLFVLFRCRDKHCGTRWCCVCSCGNVISVRASEVFTKKRTHCGCKRRMSKYENELTGQIFGRLTCIEMILIDKTIYWKCLCTCGKTILVKRNDLLRGHTKSCGCLKRDGASKRRMKNLIGQRFGKLIVVKSLGIYNHHQYWLCQCDCGNFYISYTRNLKQGWLKSCGCLKSYGERDIEKLLDESGIPYITQYTYNNCRFPNTNRPAKFDFLVNHLYVIEYDGDQHFKNSHGRFKSTLSEIRYRDLVKNSYCFQNNIPIIRIPYTHLNKICIEDLLLETSQFVLTPENEAEYFPNSDEILGGEIISWKEALKLSA